MLIRDGRGWRKLAWWLTSTCRREGGLSAGRLCELEIRSGQLILGNVGEKFGGILLCRRPRAEQKSGAKPHHPPLKLRTARTGPAWIKNPLGLGGGKHQPIPGSTSSQSQHPLHPFTAPFSPSDGNQIRGKKGKEEEKPPSFV